MAQPLKWKFGAPVASPQNPAAGEGTPATDPALTQAASTNHTNANAHTAESPRPQATITWGLPGAAARRARVKSFAKSSSEYGVLGVKKTVGTFGINVKESDQAQKPAQGEHDHARALAGTTESLPLGQTGYQPRSEGGTPTMSDSEDEGLLLRGKKSGTRIPGIPVSVSESTSPRAPIAPDVQRHQHHKMGMNAPPLSPSHKGQSYQQQEQQQQSSSLHAIGSVGRQRTQSNRPSGRLRPKEIFANMADTFHSAIKGETNTSNTSQSVPVGIAPPACSPTMNASAGLDFTEVLGASHRLGNILGVSRKSQHTIFSQMSRQKSRERRAGGSSGGGGDGEWDVDDVDDDADEHVGNESCLRDQAGDTIFTRIALVRSNTKSRWDNIHANVDDENDENLDIMADEDNMDDDYDIGFVLSHRIRTIGFQSRADRVGAIGDRGFSLHAHAPQSAMVRPGVKKLFLDKDNQDSKDRDLLESSDMYQEELEEERKISHWTAPAISQFEAESGSTRIGPRAILVRPPHPAEMPRTVGDAVAPVLAPRGSGDGDGTVAQAVNTTFRRRETKIAEKTLTEVIGRLELTNRLPSGDSALQQPLETLLSEVSYGNNVSLPERQGNAMSSAHALSPKITQSTVTSFDTRAEGNTDTVMAKSLRESSATPDSMAAMKSPQIVESSVIPAAVAAAKPSMLRSADRVAQSRDKLFSSPVVPYNQQMYDDEATDYMLSSGEMIRNRYLLLRHLGKGTFGHVLQAYDVVENRFVAVKIVKSHKDYVTQTMQEIYVLQYLMREDPDDSANIMRVFDTFMYRGHPVMVTEFLSASLYDILIAHEFRGIPLREVISIGQQILECLAFLAQDHVNLMHCDLKPENILFRSSNVSQASIKVIDFGCACRVNNSPSLYIQSRFYRAPEIIIGASFNTRIDLWSLGCIMVELLLGVPLFPGNDSGHLLALMIGRLGMPPEQLLDGGAQTTMYFDKAGSKPNEEVVSLDTPKYVLKEEYQNVLAQEENGNKSLMDYIFDHLKSKNRIDVLRHPKFPGFMSLVTDMLKWIPEDRTAPNILLKLSIFDPDRVIVTTDPRVPGRSSMKSTMVKDDFQHLHKDTASSATANRNLGSFAADAPSMSVEDFSEILSKKLSAFDFSGISNFRLETRTSQNHTSTNRSSLGAKGKPSKPELEEELDRQKLMMRETLWFKNRNNKARKANAAKENEKIMAPIASPWAKETKLQAPYWRGLHGRGLYKYEDRLRSKSFRRDPPFLGGAEGYASSYQDDQYRLPSTSSLSPILKYRWSRQEAEEGMVDDDSDPAAKRTRLSYVNSTSVLVGIPHRASLGFMIPEVPFGLSRLRILEVAAKLRTEAQQCSALDDDLRFEDV